MLQQKKIYSQIVSVFRENHIAIAFGLLLGSLVFSYQPLVSFGTFSGTNLKFSLVHIATILFIFVSIRRIYQHKYELLNQTGVKLFLLLCTLSTLGTLWSGNAPRGLLMSGFLWVLFFLFVAVQVNIKALAKKKKELVWSLMASMSLACVFAWWQVLADSLAVSSVFTLLPLAYQASVFGFARPTAFALEPQFLGSLLLIPIFIATSWHYYNKGNLATNIMLIVATSTLLLTISRGALIGLGLGLLIITILAKPSLKKILQLATLLILSTGVAVLLSGAAAQLDSRDSVDGKAAVSRSINHISLGLINLPQPTTSQAHPKDTQPNPEPTSSQKEPSSTLIEAPVLPSTQTNSSSGYIEDSTNSRLLMTREALAIWSANIPTVLFGVGTGGFGTALHDKSPTYASQSIVNNQYIEVLTELGIIGLLVFTSLLLFPIYKLFKLRQWAILAILGALYSQWLFFSGNINVPHLWIVLAVAYALPYLYTSTHEYRNSSQSIRKRV